MCNGQNGIAADMLRILLFSIAIFTSQNANYSTVGHEVFYVPSGGKLTSLEEIKRML
jgi:hypothetical protein